MAKLVIVNGMEVRGRELHTFTIMTTLKIVFQYVLIQATMFTFFGRADTLVILSSIK